MTLQCQSYGGTVTQSLGQVLTIDVTTFFQRAESIQLNSAVVVNWTTLVMRSDGTWQWDFEIYDGSIFRGDNYIFSFNLGGVVGVHQESLSVKATDVRSFKSDLPDDTILKNWPKLFAQQAQFSGDASDKLSFPVIGQWIQDHWGDILAVVAAAGGVPA